MSTFPGAAFYKYDGKENIPPTPVSEHDRIALNRAKNTEAARRSRARKLQERNGLIATIAHLQEEIRVWKNHAAESEARYHDIMVRAANSWRPTSGYRSAVGRAISSTSGASLEIPESPQSSAEGSLSPQDRLTSNQDFLQRTFDDGLNSFAQSANTSHANSEPALPVTDNYLAAAQRTVVSDSAAGANTDVHMRDARQEDPVCNTIIIQPSERTRNLIRYTGQVAKRRIESSMKGAKTRNPYLRELAKLADQHVATNNVLPYNWQRARRDAGAIPDEEPMVVRVSGSGRIIPRGQKELVQSIYDSLGRNDVGPVLQTQKQKEWVNGVEVVDLTDD